MSTKKAAGLKKRLFVILLLFGPAFILVFIGTSKCTHKFKRLDDFGVAAGYTFTDIHGKERSYKEFDDQVVLVTTLQLTCILLLFGPAFILVFIGTSKCTHKFKRLDDFGVAAGYTFTDIHGKERSYKEFDDQVVLVTTLQLTCPDNCAISLWHIDQLVYQKMRRTIESGGVRIISFVTDGEGNPVEDLSSVDEMLKDRIKDYNPDLWILASGDAKKVYDFERNDEKLLREGDEFYGKQAFQELLLLLDRNNHLRMVLSGKTEGMIRRMNQHVSLLQKEYDQNQFDESNK